MYELLHQRFWSLLHAALTSHPAAKLIFLEPNEARVVLNERRLVVILLDEKPKEHIALQNWAKLLLEENPVREIDIFVVSPTTEVDQTLSETEFQVPWTTRLAIITVDEAGDAHEITPNQADGFDRHILELCRLSTASIEQLKQGVRNVAEAQTQTVVETVRFQRKIADYFPWATHSLLAVIGAFYIFEVLLGASTYTPGLVRMGADSFELVSKGQYWRLVTSIFLHAGFLHIAMNGYVLYALGTFFNKLIGNARFLTLFFLSGVSGSLASVYVSHASVSVGASGALWGLFGLGAALIMKPSHYLPDSIRQNLRNVTIINLAINIGFSFAVPMIDKWAHFGGGIAGFVIGLLFLYEPKFKGSEALHSALAAISCTAVVFCLAMNLYVEKPWLLSKSPEFTSRSIFNGELNISIPSFLNLKSEQDDEVSFGDINFEPFVIVVLRQQLHVTPDQLRRDLNAQVKAPIREKTFDGKIIFSTEIRDKERNILDWRYWLWSQDSVILVEVVAQEDIPKVLTENLDKIVESIHVPIRI